MPLEARKIGFAAARKAGHGKKQLRRGWTTATAQPGDWIATNLSPDREILRDKDRRENTCVINVENFPNINELIDGANQFGQFIKAKNVVEALYLSGGFDIPALWGQWQIAGVGNLLSDGRDVYGNAAPTFDATHEIVPG